MKPPLYPYLAIRARCLDCAENSAVIAKCRERDCSLWHYRMSSKEGKPTLTRLKAIRQYCLWCCCDSAKEVRLCPVKECSLWHYRLGRRPQFAERSRNFGNSYPFLDEKPFGRVTPQAPPSFSKNDSREE